MMVIHLIQCQPGREDPRCPRWPDPGCSPRRRAADRGGRGLREHARVRALHHGDEAARSPGSTSAVSFGSPPPAKRSIVSPCWTSCCPVTIMNARDKNKLFNLVWNPTCSGHGLRTALFEALNATPALALREDLYRIRGNPEARAVMRELAGFDQPLRISDRPSPAARCAKRNPRSISERNVIHFVVVTPASHHRQLTGYRRTASSGVRTTAFALIAAATSSRSKGSR